MPSSNGPLHGTRNKLKNKPRDRGTSPPQRQVEQYEPGEKVHLRIDPSVPKGRFHPRFNGHTGEIEASQGRAYKVTIVDGSKEKTVIANPAHLRRQVNE
jgi:large subunit ribosomal protein L21e